MISETHPKARKEHFCMACDFIREACNQEIFTFSEYRDIIKMKKKNWKILKGEKYLCQVNKDDEIYRFKASYEMHKLCLKYDLYDI